MGSNYTRRACVSSAGGALPSLRLQLEEPLILRLAERVASDLQFDGKAGLTVHSAAVDHDVRDAVRCATLLHDAPDGIVPRHLGCPIGRPVMRDALLFQVLHDVLVEVRLGLLVLLALVRTRLALLPAQRPNKTGKSDP